MKDNEGNSPLYYSIKNEEFVDFLLKNEADVNQRCSNGNTSLHNAFKHGNLMVLY